jgi:hypothetical protein
MRAQIPSRTRVCTSLREPKKPVARDSSQLTRFRLMWINACVRLLLQQASCLIREHRMLASCRNQFHLQRALERCVGES